MSTPQAVTRRERRLAEIGVLVTMVVWSGNFVVVKGAMGTFGPVTFSAIRFTLAALLLLGILRMREGSFRWPGRRAPVLVALGATGFGVYQVLWMLGLTQVSAGDSALLIAAAPVFTALLAAAVGMDRLTAPKLGGALLALVYSGALAAAMANVFVMRAIGIIGPTRVVASQFLVPAGAVALGAQFLAESVSVWQVLGGAVIVLGVWITRQARIVPAGLRARPSSGA